MIIKTLLQNDIDNVMELFCQCFLDDSYYGQMFPDASTRETDMKGSFVEHVSFCIDQGLSLGVFEKDELIAFILCIDYGSTRETDGEKFKKIFAYDGDEEQTLYKRKLHERVYSLRGKTVYLVSIAVKPEYRMCGIASELIDMTLRSHPDVNFAGDVSNPDSLEIYKKRNFLIEQLSEEYYLVIRSRNTAEEAEYSDDIKLLVPYGTDLTQYGANYKVIKEKRYLFGYSTKIHDGKECFCASDSVTQGTLVQTDYQGLLKYQRGINILLYIEEKHADMIFYVADHGQKPLPDLMNGTLRSMTENRKSEWDIVPDTFVLIPAQYNNKEKIISNAVNNDARADIVLKNYAFRTEYELGIQSLENSVDELSSCKKRIKRFYLGKLLIQIFTETSVECDERLAIGGANYVDLYVSIDEESDCAVFAWHSPSTPFLLSHYFDNIIRNQVMVVLDGKTVNIFDYLGEKFGIIKKGTPKIFTVISDKKEVLTPSQRASLMAGETIYPDGENFGGIADEQILRIVNSEHGMGQYDRGSVYAYSNVVIQFSPDMKASFKSRMNEEVITLFYMELILFHEAAIHIADRSIAAIFTTDDIDSPIDFLNAVDRINDEYSKTIDFWDLRVNYPTSQKSMEILKDAFRINEQLEYLNRNQEYLKTVFAIKCDIADRKDSKRVNASLAIISVLAIFSALVDSHAYMETWGGILSAKAIDVIQQILFLLIVIAAVYAVVHLVKGSISLMMRKQKRKQQKTKRNKKQKNKRRA